MKVSLKGNVLIGLQLGDVIVLDNVQDPVVPKLTVVPSVIPVIVIFPVATELGLSPPIVPAFVVSVYDPDPPPVNGIDTL